MRIKLSLVAVPVLLVVATPAGAKTAGTGCSSSQTKFTWSCILGSGTAAGDYATITAAGTIKRPADVGIILRTRRQYRDGGIDLHWTATCSRGYGAGSRSGRVRSASTFKDDIGQKFPYNGNRGVYDLPLPMRNSDECIVAATAQLPDSGGITILLIGFQR